MITTSLCAINRPTSTDEPYEFVNPSDDFRCPVTFDVLLNPHQTHCCGHQLSAETAIKLQREGKACPMCNEPHFTSSLDKHFRRKVNEQQVYCPNRKRGCKWMGQLGNVDSHKKSCPAKKRPIQADVGQILQTP